MANNTAQIEKDKRGFVSPIMNTPPEAFGKLWNDIRDKRAELHEVTRQLLALIDIQDEVIRSMRSDLNEVYRPGAIDYITSKDAPGQEEQ